MSPRRSGRAAVIETVVCGHAGARQIATLAGAAGPGWVEAIGIAEGRVVAAGSRAEVDAAAPPTVRRITLAPDEVAIPGLTDAHLHLADAALARRQLDLEGCASRAELVQRVRAFVAGTPSAVDEWIEGAGWEADTLGGWPTAAELEAAAPGRLVALWAHDHHAMLVSPAALARGGIEDTTPDPPGGVIRRDAGGSATGVLHEAATRLVSDHIPDPADAVIAAAIHSLGLELVRLGVVAVHDPGGLAATDGLGGSIAAYRSLAAVGRLPLRVHACISPEQLGAAIAAGLRSGAPLGQDPLDRLRLGWLKTFADGSLGSRTAALLEPLEPLPGEPAPPNEGYGVWVTEPAELRELALRAAAGGIANQIHGIGDAAVRAALDALAPTVGATQLMPRVEHTQLVAEADIGRFAALGIAASMQPIHVRSDAAAARRLWGGRAETRGYAMGRLLRAGAVVASGTDAPVEPVDPWPGVACAVTRSGPSWAASVAPFGPDGALTLWESIRSWCIAPAVTAGENDRGRLVAGSRADIVVLPAAALTEPVEPGGALWHARPRMVFMDGEIVAEA
jgi:predicted amidohydrolase YtcJ